MPPFATLLASGLWMSAWVAGALLTQGDRDHALVLAAAQGVLALLTIETIRVTLRPSRSRTGVDVLPVVALHVALYYGVFNVVPALLMDWRPPLYFATSRVPEASISSYIAATWAAASMLVGIAMGCRLAGGLFRKRSNLPTQQGNDRFLWLPGFRTSIAVALAITVVMLFATARYGTQYESLTADVDRMTALPFWEQLIFYGVVPFLPLPALVAAAALLSARTRQERLLAKAVLVLLAAFSIAALSVWGMRSAAILVLLLPMALFAYAGRIRWRMMILPAIALGTLVYGVVTVARISNLGEQIGSGTTLSPSTAGAVLGAGADQDALVQKFVADMSYRTSGLEAVAAIVDGQHNGALAPMDGKVVLSGFLQALPVALRPEPELPNRIKTAPAEAGLFVPGDYVTTLLSELVMDVGPWVVVLPAIVVGVILSLFDRTLLMIGQRSAFQPLLVVRMAWLLMVLNSDGLANATVMFLKGTIGYSVLFIVCGLGASVASRLPRTK